MKDFFELYEGLRKDIAKNSGKFPEGGTVKCKKSGKTGKVLTVGKDFVKVAVGNKQIDYKPSDLELVKEEVEQADENYRAASAQSNAANKMYGRTSDSAVKKKVVSKADLFKALDKKYGDPKKKTGIYAKEEVEIDEAMMDTWTVELPALKKKVPVRARNSQEAIKKAAKVAGVDWKTVKLGKVQKEEVDLNEGAVAVSTVEKDIKKNGGTQVKKDDRSITFVYKGSKHKVPVDRGFVKSDQYMKLQDMMEEADLNEGKKFVVKYTGPDKGKSGKTTGPMSKAAAEKKAAMGNKVDKVGGKYEVLPFVEEVN